jgi:hypothetical protein
MEKKNIDNDDDDDDDDKDSNDDDDNDATQMQLNISYHIKIIIDGHNNTFMTQKLSYSIILLLHYLENVSQSALQ